MRKEWKPETLAKVKARALGTYQFDKPNQFGPDGPQPEHIGYVFTEDYNVNDMDSVYEKFYRMFFEEFPGTFFIGFDYTGKFSPYQEELFTTEK
jgi:hypothetical protein